MFIFVAADTGKKNVQLSISMDKFKLVVKGETIIDGKWSKKINAEETYWTIEEGELEGYKGKYIHVNVEKWSNQTSWWSTPIQGHAEINTQKINP